MDVEAQYDGVRSSPETEAMAPRPPVPAEPPAQPTLTCGAKVWLGIATALSFFGIATSAKPGQMFVAYAMALAPGGAVFAAIRNRLSDRTVTLSFLLSSFFILGLPGIIIVIILELVITVVGLLLVFGDTLSGFISEYESGIADIQAGSGDVSSLSPEQHKRALDQVGKLWDRIRSEIPVWRLILAVLVLAFAVAAFTEEMSKYVVARRHRKLVIDGISVRGVIACASAGALGLATVEHLMYATGYLAQMSFGGAILEGLYRALIAFPLHVGTGFYMGTRMARHSVLKDPKVNPLKTLAVPVLFHGALDSFAFFASAEGDAVPLLTYAVLPFNIGLLLLLMRLCRKNYQEVVALEASTISAENEDALSESVDARHAGDAYGIGSADEF